ncbi:peptidylprolyl isomerase [Altererythrobacter luteolus]|uniref:Parvulin-like PPIase n=1 Tax=Pontixanthobacter luteolus TaxID=295089 RepID=A0A6I4UZB9_9SPHN|nr:peptidylprolyl isomerase [Pontixanthobacter luteolus]MXP46116.1 peptidylprolyl isomerase [Pontixanthobacter luteolus]
MKLTKLGSKLLGGLATLGLAASPIALQAQAIGQSGASNSNVLNIPDNVVLMGQSDPNVRTATAVVNGTVITGTDVDHRTALLTAASEGELPPEELRRVRMQVLRNLIDETLQIQEAAAQEIEISDGQVNQRYQTLAAQNFGQQTEAMDQYLLSIGSSPASLKRQIKGELAWTSLLRRNISPFINVSEEEVREELKRMEAEKGTEEFRLGEIYLSATAENLETVQQNAAQIVDQLRQGGSFVAYARQFSEASTASVGGDLGWVRLPQLPRELSSQATQMQPGELRGPIPIPGGFSILFLIDKRQILMADPRDATLSLKQISISFSPGVTEASAAAKVETFTNAVASMRGCGDAESVAAGIGADVVSNEIVARQLPEQLQASLLNLQVGQTTPPFGSVNDGVRVLMLCGRDDPETVGGPTIDDLIAQKEEERIQKRAQRYLRDLRNDAYIEYN